MIAQTATTTVWKKGTRNTNVEFADLKQLQKQEPKTFGLLQMVEGFTTQDQEYEYHVGMSKFGFWVSRKHLEIEEPTSTATVSDPTLIAVLAQLTDAVRLLTLAHLASSTEEKENIRKQVMAQ